MADLSKAIAKVDVAAARKIRETRETMSFVEALAWKRGVEAEVQVLADDFPNEPERACTSIGALAVRIDRGER